MKIASANDIIQVLEKLKDEDFSFEVVSEDESWNDVSATLNEYIQNAKIKKQNLIEKHNKENKNALFEVQLGHQILDANLKKLDQGFFIFDKECKLGNVFSNSCEELLEADFDVEELWSILRHGENDTKDWVDLLFSGALGFDDVKVLGPQTFMGEAGRHIELDYEPVYDDFGELGNVLVVVVDRTKQIEIEKKIKESQDYSDKVLKIIQSRNYFFKFKEEMYQLEEDIKKYFESSSNDLKNLFRYVHTLKGTSGMFSMNTVLSTAHEFEEFIKKYMDLDEDELEFIDIDDQLKEKARPLFKALHNDMDEVCDILGISQDEKSTIRIKEESLNEFAQSLESFPEIQNQFIEHFVYEPISNLFDKYKDLVYRLAEELDKKIQPIEIDHNNIKIDAKKYATLFSTMVHMFRNSIDHGVETPDEREIAGKSIEGKISVRTIKKNIQQTEWLFIQVIDDGAGINPEIIRNKLIEKGYDEKIINNESNEEIIQHVFDSRFSSKDEVSTISGQGVGLDAVKTEVGRLGGTVKIGSQLEKGTCFTIAIPMQISSQSSSKKAA